MRKNRITTSSRQSAEQGFTVGSVVLICILIAVVWMGVRFVSHMNAANKEQGANLQSAFNGDEQPLADEEKRGADEKDATVEEQSAREEDIKRVNVDIDSLGVALTATLQGTYYGTCYADIELPDGSNHVRYVQPLEAEHECTITIPSGKLGAGRKWKFMMGFYSKDGTVRGSHPEQTFSL